MVVFVDVDTTGLRKDANIWRIAFRPHGQQTALFEWWDDTIEDSTLEYLDIKESYLNTLPDFDRIPASIEQYLNDVAIGQQAVPLLVFYDHFSYQKFIDFDAKHFNGKLKFLYRPYPVLITSLLMLLTQDMDLKSYTFDALLPLFNINRPNPKCETDVRVIEEIYERVSEEFFK